MNLPLKTHLTVLISLWWALINLCELHARDINVVKGSYKQEGREEAEIGFQKSL